MPLYNARLLVLAACICTFVFQCSILQQSAAVYLHCQVSASSVIAYVLRCLGLVPMQVGRSYPYAGAGGRGCPPAAHGFSHQGVKIMLAAAGTLNGVVTSSTDTQRKLTDMQLTFVCTPLG